MKDKERFEKRILEELSKIFTETDSFFFCRTGDITNSLQRQCVMEFQQDQDNQNKPLWQRVDDRFFWNKHMLHDIISLNVSNFYERCLHLQLASLYCTCVIKCDEKCTKCIA